MFMFESGLLAPSLLWLSGPAWLVWSEWRDLHALRKPDGQAVRGKLRLLRNLLICVAIQGIAIIWMVYALKAWGVG